MLGYITQHFKKSRNITYCILCYENVNSYNYLTAELNRNAVSYPIPLLFRFMTSVEPRPFEGEEKDLVPIAHPCANYPKKTWGTMNDCTLYCPFAVAYRVQSYTNVTSLRTLRTGGERKSIQSFAAPQVFLG